MIMHTFKKYIIGILALPLVAVCSILLLPSHTSALDPSSFNPGIIIEDSIFTNNTSMSASDIQSFLNAKNSTCLRNYTTLSLVDYDGNGSIEDTTTEPYGKNGTTMSAAQIIKAAADLYKINPQVILVFLQKEQSLITRTDCPSTAYNSAIGFACPDSGPCNAARASFTAQIDYGVYHLRGFFDDTLAYVPYGVGTQTVLYNPDTRCESQPVNIQNRATASLYSYTPYQPNSAALNWLLGSGPAVTSAYLGPGNNTDCGAFGNLNFFIYFNNWFGPTLGPAYVSEFHSQNAHISMFTGETKTIWFKFKNIGRAAWGDDVSSPGNPIHFATNNAINRSSIFASQWPTSSRPNFLFSKVYEADGTTLASNQHVVERGQVAMFEVTIKANEALAPGVYKEDFAPIREGAPDWWVGPNVWTNITVQPTYKATFSSQSIYPTLTANDKADLFMSFKNSGNASWYDDTSVPVGQKPVHLATANPINNQSVFGRSWPTPSRPGLNFTKVYEADGVTLAANQHVVAPGQIGRFDFTVTGVIGTPPSYYQLALQPILEGAPNWDLGASAWIGITYLQGTRTAQYHSQSTWPTVARGGTAAIYFQYKNTGTASWRDDLSNIRGLMPIHLASTGPINRVSPFANGSWVNNNRPAVNLSRVFEADGVTLAANQHVVAPGQIGRFDFTITVPSNTPSGSYIEYYQPILEGAPGLSWVIDGVVFMKVTVP